MVARAIGHTGVVAILCGSSALFGAEGYLGWQLSVPEPVLFWSFFGSFFANHHWIQRAWRKLDNASPNMGREATNDEEKAPA